MGSLLRVRDQRPCTFQVERSWQSSKLLMYTNKTEINLLSWLERNMDLEVQETGQPRDHTSRVLKQLLLRPTKEFIDPTWLEWVSCHYNSRKVRMLIHMDSMGKNNSPSSSKEEI